MKQDCIPFLRWPGGKRWISDEIVRNICKAEYTRYVEPFLGGGAVFFQLQPNNAILSDLNNELVETYKTVKTSSDELIDKLKALPVSKEKYYEIRQWKPESSLDVAVRFLYLNRLAFAGMYRVNSKGQFNVPYGDGRRVNILWEKNMISHASKVLQRANIVSSDFNDIMRDTGHGDIVYCDPTYTASHNNNGFIRYNENVFKWEDQIRLAQAALGAVGRGATVIVSNAAHDAIAKLYPVKPITVSRHTCISRSPHGRKLVDEFIFYLRP